MKYKLSGIMDLIGGGTPKTSVAEYWDGDIPWLSVKDFSSGFRYVYKTEKTITEAGLKNSSTKMLKRNDSIISARGTVGEMAMIPFPMAFNQSCYGLRAKKELVDPTFLYYLVKHNVHILQKNTHGSIFDTITRETFDGIDVEVPDMDTQLRIAGILCDLDDKIELNSKIIDNLQQQLQAIYQMIFGKPSQDSKAGGHLSDICTYSQRRIAVSSLSAERYYSTENMLPGKTGAVAASSLPTIAQTTGCMPGDILISNIRPYFKKIVYCQSECGCSTDVLCFVPKSSDLSLYLYGTLYDDHFFDHMVAGSKGTKMPRGDKQQIMAYPIVLPSAFQLIEFNDIAQPILAKIEAGSQENKHLSSVRDTMLPKLMSGEIDVSSITL